MAGGGWNGCPTPPGGRRAPARGERDPGPAALVIRPSQEGRGRRGREGPRPGTRPELRGWPAARPAPGAWGAGPTPCARQGAPGHPLLVPG